MSQQGAPSDWAICPTSTTPPSPTRTTTPPQSAAALSHGAAKRVVTAITETRAGKEVFESEVVPPGQKPLTARSTDEESDGRCRAVGMPHAHAWGSASMGKVADTSLRGLGVQGCRVVDASVLPVPISGHPQATLYALAEVVADVVLRKLDRVLDRVGW
jgi:choline dehydrogenase-like flavoprotein